MHRFQSLSSMLGTNDFKSNWVCRGQVPDLSGALLATPKSRESSEEAQEVESQQSYAAAVAQRTERLSKRTRTHPSDVDAWLKYAAHQDEALRVSGVSDRAKCLRAVVVWLHFDMSCLPGLHRSVKDAVLNFRPQSY
jgi:hypothetical protein